MKLELLGYSHKWLEYEFLTEEKFQEQIAIFQQGEDQNTEHYRYATYSNWIVSHTHFTDQEIHQLIELLKGDQDEIMAGAVLKNVFTSSKTTESQFLELKEILPFFGDWTEKLIARECLMRRILSEKITFSLFEECIVHQKQFNELTALELVLEKCEDITLLNKLDTEVSSKKIKEAIDERKEQLKKIRLLEKLDVQKINQELIEEFRSHQKEYHDNTIMVILVKKCEDITLLNQFLERKFSKPIRKAAKARINEL